jgi:hypothetical protein
MTGTGSTAGGSQQGGVVQCGWCPVLLANDMRAWERHHEQAHGISGGFFRPAHRQQRLGHPRTARPGRNQMSETTDRPQLPAELDLRCQDSVRVYKHLVRCDYAAAHAGPHRAVVEWGNTNPTEVRQPK